MGRILSAAELHTRQMARMAGKQAARDKWPPEVASIKKGVMESYRQLVLPDGRRFRFFYRTLKGQGVWATAKGWPVFHGKNLTEATLRLVEAALA